jgi:hypothetical protein
MAPQSKLQLLQGERRKLQKAIAEMEARLAELDIAERVFGSLTHTAPTARVVLKPRKTKAIRVKSTKIDRVEAPPTLKVETTRAKPAGLPSVPEMICAAIQGGAKVGKDGMEPREMVDFIAHKWWPNIPPESVGPIAWRMYKQGRLEKDGPKYRLPVRERAQEAA